MNNCILLTGATGFLGTQIAHHILRNSDASVVVLLRAPHPDEAKQHLLRQWWDWPELRSFLDARIRVLAGDITHPELGIQGAQYDMLVQQVTHIVHAAANIRLFDPLDGLRKVNVTGTQHVLTLAQAAHEHHGLQRFAHISTAYVCGARSGPITEEELTDQYGFSNAYERSKYEAELLVRQAATSIPVSIFRPGMIVGDSQTGAVKTFNTKNRNTPRHALKPARLMNSHLAK